MRAALRAWVRRLAALTRSARLDAELQDELEAHRVLLQTGFEREGLSPEQAARASRREMGGLLTLREHARGVWFGSLETWWRDLCLAGRGLRRSPGFAVAVILTLAIGLTGAVTMVSIIQAVFLQPLPVRDEGRLVVGWRSPRDQRDKRWPFRTLDLDLIRRDSRSFSGVAGIGYHDPGRLSFADLDVTAYIQGARVTGEFFDVLGARPLIGRTLALADDVVGAENALVLTARLWHDRYGGSPDVLGRRVRINDQPFTVVGVMPPDVDFPRHVDAWMSVAAAQTTNPLFRDAMRQELDLIARMHTGVSLRQAAEELRSLVNELELVRSPGDPAGLVPNLDTFRRAVVGDIRGTLLLLAAAVTLVLLVACANVTNLLLLRGEERRAEFSVRAALGAGRLRLLRQVLAESLVLAACATAVALLLATWTIPILLTWVPGGLPRAELIRVDLAVVGSSVAVALLVVHLSAAAPALAASRANLVPGIRRVAVTHPRRTRRVLVAWQVALAVAVVAGAGVVLESLQRLEDVSAALQTDQLVLVPLDLPPTRYAERVKREQFMTALAARFDGTAGVGPATAVNMTPFSDLGWDAPTFTGEGQTLDDARANPALNLEEIQPNYFDTFAVPVLRGRVFTVDDRADTRLVAMVSRDVADRLWPGLDPIGQRLKMGGPDSPDLWRTVIGVVAPTRYREIREPRATIYVPAAQLRGAAHDLVVRTSAPLAMLADRIRDHVRSLDPEVRVMPLRPLSGLLEGPLARPRFAGFLLSVFGAAALSLASVGLYAVMAASVRQPQREFGVRLALGATAGRVRLLIVAEGCAVVGVGAVVGLALTAAATQGLRGLLLEVPPLDPRAWSLGVALLAAAAAASLYLPARRAGRVNPATMLRAE